MGLVTSGLLGFITYTNSTVLCIVVNFSMSDYLQHRVLLEQIFNLMFILNHTLLEEFVPPNPYGSTPLRLDKTRIKLKYGCLLYVYSFANLCCLTVLHQYKAVYILFETPCIKLM